MPGVIRQPKQAPDTITAERKGLWSIYDPAVRRDVMDWMTAIDGFGSTDRASKGLCLIHGGAVAIALLETLGFVANFVNWERVKEHNPFDKGVNIVLDGDGSLTATTLADVDNLATAYLAKVRAEVKAEVIAEAQAKAKAKAEALKAQAEQAKKAK